MRSKLQSALTSANRDRGFSNERRAIQALTTEKGITLPSWFKGAELSSREEDRAGIDLIVTTDVGKIFVQVKSSIAGVENFTKKHPKLAKTAVIVILQNSTNLENTRNDLIAAIAMKRDEFLAKRLK